MVIFLISLLNYFFATYPPADVTIEVFLFHRNELSYGNFHTNEYFFIKKYAVP